MFNCLRMVQPGSFLLSIHAKPGAKTSSFVGPLSPSESAVEVRVAAPPVEGAANEELVSFIGDSLDSAHRRGDWEKLVDGMEASLETTANAAHSGRKDKGNNKGSSKKPNANTSTGPLPTKVKVSFHSGTTSRSKVLALELPCESLTKAWALLLAASAE